MIYLKLFLLAYSACLCASMTIVFLDVWVRNYQKKKARREAEEAYEKLVRDAHLAAGACQDEDCPVHGERNRQRRAHAN